MGIERTLDDLLRHTERTAAGCLRWKGATNGKLRPYGRLLEGGRFVRVHRRVWELAIGPIPAGQQVLHACDDTLCIEPSHLFLGSHQDNMDDRTRKGRNRPLKGAAWYAAHAGRHPSGADHYMAQRPETIRHGSECAHAKLTEAQVLEIRRAYADGSSRYGLAKRLAAQYGVDRTLVWQIATRRIWTHV